MEDEATIVRQLMALGDDADHATLVAKDAVASNSPDVARFTFLRKAWTWDIDPLRYSLGWVQIAADNNDGPVRRMIQAGMDPADIGLLAATVAYNVTFSFLERLDEGLDPELPGHPGWALVEADSNGCAPGRRLGFLHEEILTLDPSGREGSDLNL